MYDPTQYELLDFGHGRKLERFGEVVLDRPSPAAEGKMPARADLWASASAQFELYSTAAGAGQRGKWEMLRDVPEIWDVKHRSAVFELKLTDFGHIGLFPEQAACWDWIAEQIRFYQDAACGFAGINLIRTDPFLCNVLNLFAYTGGSTMAAAGAGAQVAHIDAAKNIVARGRRNAVISSLRKAPIRWITEDALKFAKREVRRGRKYHGIILDPPSYGHGPSGEVWKLDEQLPELLAVCAELIAPYDHFMLLTCHAPGYDAEKLARLLNDVELASNSHNIEAGTLWLTTGDGRKLHSGAFARIAARRK